MSSSLSLQQVAAAAPDTKRNRRAWRAYLGKRKAAAFLDSLAPLRRSIEARAFDCESRVALLDRVARQLSGLSGFFLPRSDRYDNEFLPLSAERLRFFSGFSGSSGWAVLDFRQGKKSCIASDGRYRLQLARECDPALFECLESNEHNPSQTLVSRFTAGSRIGYDPWRISHRGLERLRDKARSLVFVPVRSARLDSLWLARPPEPLSPLVQRASSLMGESAEARLERLRAYAELQEGEGEGEALFLNACDSSAWGLSFRGGDIPYLPVALGYGLVSAREAVFFTSAQRPQVGALSCRLSPEGGMLGYLSALGMKRLVLDSSRVPAGFVRACRRRGLKLREARDPTLALREVKTQRERANIRKAHIWDGVAVTRFLAWLSACAERRFSPSEEEAADQLMQFRNESGKDPDPSFETISASAANSACVHYRLLDNETPRRLERGQLYLIDSGAHYEQGTTDITRTLLFGGLPMRQESHKLSHVRRAYTAVLRGHIALARTLFPEGTAASALDSIARRPLWQIEADYAHGTGHGVGCCLAVHEGDTRIAARPSTAPVKEGMILSNEPGYYEANAFGIRLENLVEVLDSKRVNSEGKRILEFRTLSLAPIDTCLIEPAALEGGGEKGWLNRYHARVRENIAPHLSDKKEQDFLLRATAALP